MANKQKPEQTTMTTKPLPDQFEYYRSMLEIIPDPTILYDTEGCVQYINPIFTSLFGWGLAELQGKKLDFVPEENKAETTQAITTLMKGEASEPFTTRRLTKDGRLLDVQITASLLKDQEQNIIGSIIFISNISRIKEVERALEASQIRYRQMLESTPDAYYEVDLNGDITYFSQGLAEVLGYPEEELLGLNNRDYTDEENAKQIYKAYNKVFETGEPQKAALMHTIRKDGTPQILESSIALLLNDEGEPIGFRGIARDVTERVQAEDALAAVMIEQEQMAAHLETVAIISTAVSTILDPQEMLQTLVDLTKENFGFYHAHVYLLNQAGDTLEIVAGAGDVGLQMVKEKRQIPLSQENSIVARSAHERKGVNVRDVNKEPAFLPHPLLPETRAELAVPLMIGEQILGVLDVQSDTPGYFSNRDMSIQTTLAAQVAVALQNARLFEQSNVQSDRLQLLNEMSNALNGARNMEDALDIISRYSLEILGGDRASLYLYDAHNETIELISLSGLKGTVLSKTKFTLQETLLSRVVKENRLLQLPEEIDFEAYPDTKSLADEYGIKSLVLSPLVMGAEIIGTLNVSSKTANAYGPIEINLMQQVSAVIANTLQVRQLFEKAEERASELGAVAEVSTAVSTILDPHEMLQAVVDLTKERFNLYHTHIYLLDETGDTLKLTAGAGEVGQQMVSEGRQIPLDQEQSLVARAAREHLGVIVNDVKQEKGFLPHALLPDTRSEMAVPMIIGDQVLGVIDIQSDEVNYFTKKDIHIQTTLAAQIAAALRNARLFVDTQESEEKYRTIIENIEDGYFEVDLRGSFTFVNEQVCHMIGYDHEEIIGLNYRQYMAEEVARNVFEGFNRVYETGESNKSIDYDIIRPDGRIININSSIGLIHNAKGEAVGFRGIMRDITKRKLVEEDLQKFRFGIERSNNAVFMTEPDGTIIFINPAFTGIYGYTAEEAIGQTPRILKSGVIPQKQYKQFWQTLLNKEVVAGEIINKTKDGTLIPIEGQNNPIIDNDGELVGFLSIHADITERKNTEKALAASQQDSLEFQEKLKTVSELNHEFSLFNNLDDLHRAAVEMGRSHLGFDRIGLFAYEPEHEQFRGLFGTDEKGNTTIEHHIIVDAKERLQKGWLAQGRDYRNVEDNVPLMALGEVVGRGWNLDTLLWSEEDTPIGWIVTDNLLTMSKLRPYQPELLQLYATTIAHHIKRIQTNEALAQALSESEQLYEMSARLNKTNNVSEIIEAAVLPVVTAGLAAGNLFTLEVDENGRPEWMTLVADWTSDDREETPAVVPIGTRFELNQIPSAQLWIDNPDNVILSGDVENDETLDELTKSFYEMAEIKASATLPLRLGEEWIGLLTLSWREIKSFTQDDARVFRLLAEQTAVMLNNQLLFEKTEQRAAELATVAEVGAAITTIRDVNELLQKVVDLTKERFHLYHAHIYLLNRAGDEFVLRSGAGEIGQQMVTEGHSIPLDQQQSLIALAARTREGIIVNNVAEHPDFLPHPLLPQTKSEMVIPIIVEDEVLGILDVQADQISRFTENDVRTKSTLAAQIGVALQNARSFARSEQAVQDLENMTKQLRREGWQTYFEGQKSSQMGFQFAQNRLAPLPAVKTKKKKAKQKETNGSAQIAQPLLVQGESIGHLKLAEPEALSDDANDIMTAVAERLSAHIENLRLTEQTQRALSETEIQAQRLVTLNEISTELGNATDLMDIYQIAVKRTVELLKADRASVPILMADGENLEIAAYYGLEIDNPTGTILTLKDSPMELAIKQNKIQTSSGSDIIKSVRIVPLTAGGHTIGTLNVGSVQEDFFDERDESLLVQMATLLSSTIENKQLLLQTQARASELVILNEMAGELTRMLEEKPILDAIFEYTSRLMDTTNFYIAFHNPETNEVSFPLVYENGKQSQWRSRPFGNGMTEHIISTGNNLFLEQGVDAWLNEQGVESIGSTAHSWMGVPIRLSEDVGGVIALQSQEANAFQETQLNLLRAVANQAAIALQNANQFQQEQARARREQLLREISARVRGTSDVDLIMRTAVQEIGQTLGRQAYLHLNPDNDKPTDKDA